MRRWDRSGFARIAGTADAAAAAKPTISATAANVTGSSGCTRNRNPLSDSPTTAADTSPNGGTDKGHTRRGRKDELQNVECRGSERPTHGQLTPPPLHRVHEHTEHADHCQQEGRASQCQHERRTELMSSRGGCGGVPSARGRSLVLHDAARGDALGVSAGSTPDFTCVEDHDTPRHRGTEPHSLGVHGVSVPLQCVVANDRHT